MIQDKNIQQKKKVECIKFPLTQLWNEYFTSNYSDFCSARC